ncbi:MAG: hypothetical protein JRD89_03660 [Deltaproteobacteria bacterium]|nr:hypothetical protein [Deltaproteobacteria bacterium]
MSSTAYSYPSVSGSGVDKNIRLDLMGNTVTTRDLIQWAIEGRIWTASVGSASSPSDFAKTSYDEDQPQMALCVPNGTVAIPIKVEVAFETMAGTVSEAILGFCQNNIGAGTSTAVTPKPNSTAVGSTNSKCKVYSLYTGNCTALTNMQEFWRAVYPYAYSDNDTERMNFRWSMVDDGDIVILKGESSLILWVDGTTTAPTGYAYMTWAEFTTSELGL